MLASSVHLVCRPRPDAEQAQSAIENPQSKIENIGDWRDVLAELPARIHAWLPRLAAEGVVGADAIFACLGPALEIFSRYSRVEKASGETVTLKEYLEVVWAAVAREALGIIFSGADATGFEEDARLTAMWLWTLTTKDGGRTTEDKEALSEDDEEGKTSAPIVGRSSFVLEYDAARKLSQGLGAHLEKLAGLIEVKGDQARLLPVRERRKSLLGREENARPARKKDSAQMGLFETVPADADNTPSAAGWAEQTAFQAGVTILDRLHQSMLLFADGQSAALKRFLVEDGIGKDPRFWRLADALSALYPSGCDEKRWVDGVLGRKKGLGF